MSMSILQYLVKKPPTADPKEKEKEKSEVTTQSVEVEAQEKEATTDKAKKPRTSKPKSKSKAKSRFTLESSMRSLGYAILQDYYNPSIKFLIRNTTVLLGRKCKTHSNIDVHLGDEPEISRLHAKIEFNQISRFFEIVTYSKNGIKINGTKMTPSDTPTRLHSRALLEIGPRRLWFLLPANTSSKRRVDARIVDETQFDAWRLVNKDIRPYIGRYGGKRHPSDGEGDVEELGDSDYDLYGQDDEDGDHEFDWFDNLPNLGATQKIQVQLTKSRLHGHGSSRSKTRPHTNSSAAAAGVAGAVSNDGGSDLAVNAVIDVDDASLSIPQTKEETAGHKVKGKGKTKRGPTSIQTKEMLLVAPPMPEELLIKWPALLPKDEDKSWRKDPSVKPPYSYYAVTMQALVMNIGQPVTLSKLYEAISDRYPFFRGASKSWKSSVRNALSSYPHVLKISLSSATSKDAKGNYNSDDLNSTTTTSTQTGTKNTGWMLSPSFPEERLESDMASLSTQRVKRPKIDVSMSMNGSSSDVKTTGSANVDMSID